MTLSLLPAYAVFASISVAAAVCYLLLCRTVVLVNRLLQRLRPPPPSICRPGEMIHQALRITGHRSEQYRTAALVFGVAMLMLTAFGRLDWWPVAPTWAFALLAVVATGLQALGIAKIVQLTRYRMRLSRLLEMHVAVARRLADVQLRGNRVYHSVPIGAGFIDNVVVGPNGIYTVHLFPAPPNACASVSLLNGDLLFQPADVRYDLRRYRHSIGELAQALGDGIGSKVVVLPVIVVPDCPIAPSDEQLPMVISLTGCTSFVGWKDTRAFLMNDELEAINCWLAKRALGTYGASMRDVAGYLDAQVPRPALV
jgi:hypothetical protein